MQTLRQKIINPKLRIFIYPISLAILFTYIYFTHSLYRHLSYNSHAFDLGIYTHASYLYAFKSSAYNSLKQMNLLADHFEPILIILSPIYRIFPDATTLLFIQALFVSVSCIPIYFIAYDKIRSHLFSVVISISYLTSIGILSATNFDFHTTTISTLPLSLILFAWYFNLWKLYWPVLLLSLTFKEDMALFILGLGLFQLLKKQTKLGMATIFFAFTSFFLIKFVVMPFLWQGSDQSYISTSILPLTDPFSMLVLLKYRPNIFIDLFFNSPIKLSTINTLYLPFAFLPLLSPLSWLTVFPYLFLRFSSTYTQLWSTSWHHSANLIPFLAVSTILVIEKMKEAGNKFSLLIIILTFLGGLAPSSYLWYSPQARFPNLSKYSYINNAIQDLSESSAISAQSPIVPHLANREKIFLFPDINVAEYIVLDTKLSSYPITLKELEQKIEEIKKSSKWKIFKQEQSLIIFQKT